MLLFFVEVNRNIKLSSYMGHTRMHKLPNRDNRALSFCSLCFSLNNEKCIFSVVY